MWQSDFSELLKEHFQALKSANPRFSIRAYAKRIGLSAGSLSDTINNKKKWNISRDRAISILEKVSVSQAKKNRLLLKMGVDQAVPREKLDTSNYDILTNWVYYAVLFSFDLPAKLTKPEDIATRLDVSVEKVEKVIEALLRRNLLLHGNNGEYQRPSSMLNSGDGLPSELIRSHHLDGLDLSRVALHKLPADRRDFTSFTFSGSESQIAALREEIRKLHEKASVIMDGGSENDQVFRLSVQLFPMDFSK